MEEIKMQIEIKILSIGLTPINVNVRSGNVFDAMCMQPDGEVILIVGEYSKGIVKIVL
ncbi:MAG: hypothetical protein ACRC9H_14935 [Aeromonas veronii]